MEKKVVATGQKKTARAKAECTEGEFFGITINSVPFDLLDNELMVAKFKDVIAKVGLKFFESLVFKVSVSGGGSVSRIYAARQAFAKSLVAYYGTYLDEWNKQEIKSRLLSFDKFTLVSDPRRAEPKKFGGIGARARYQKSYR